MDPVDQDACHHGEDNGIQHRLYIIHKQTDRVDCHTDHYPDVAHLEIRMGLRQTDADQVLAALAAARPKYDARTEAGPQTADHGRQHRIFHQRHFRNRNHRQEGRSHHDGYQCFHTETPSHDPKRQQEERHIDQEIDDAQIIHPRNLGNPENIHQKHPDKLGDSGESSTIEMQRVDHQIHTGRIGKISDYNPQGFPEQFSVIHMIHDSLFRHICSFHHFPVPGIYCRERPSSQASFSAGESFIEPFSVMPGAVTIPMSSQ